MSRRAGRRTSKGIGLDIKYTIPAAVALGIGALVLSGRAGDLSSMVVPTPTPITYESKLEATVKEEKITFEMAKRNERLRQQYLNQIFANRDKYGVEGWDSFAGFVYDPDYNLVLDEFEKRTGNREWKGIEGYSTEKDKPFMITPHFGKPYIPLTSYVSELAFGYARSQDEILSLFDNESFHAHYYHQRRFFSAPDFPKGIVWSKEMSLLIEELYSFNKQFSYIERGIRKVSPEFVAGLLPAAKFLYHKIELAASKSDVDAKFAETVIMEMSSYPTLKYFK